ncbi:MAG: penicillin-binding protein activator LpoB, partial [Bdellovibrionota bacterium]|nr:penicillin-binding protein activator LpoB [Pseudomonadota bacterium]MDY6090718.1 penicillin-binding protein activator LpoB [Bdellovibrionota bacterium]
NRSGRDKEVLYQFTLSLKNLTTGILEWSDDKKIKKMGKRAIFGW